MQSQDLLSVLRTVKRKANVAVIYSGNPKEARNVLFKSLNPRTWKSYQRVAQDIVEALKLLGFKNVFLFKEGAELTRKLKQHNIQYAWLNSGGVQGFDAAGHCAATLQSLGIPYVGHTPLQSSLMDDKVFFKHFLLGAGFRTAPFLTWHPKDHKRHQDHITFEQKLKNIFSWDNGRCVVKPATGRASQHVYIAENMQDVLALCQKVYSETGNKVLVEQFLSGREYCVAVMGRPINEKSSKSSWWINRHQSTCCFAHLERVLEDKHSIFTSMDVRPINDTVVRKLSHDSDGHIIQELNAVAQSLYNRLGLHGLIRLDLRMDAAGRLHILEANPKPDLKAPEGNVSSLVAMGIEQIGLNYPELIEQLFIQSLDYHLSYAVTPSQLSWMQTDPELEQSIDGVAL